MKKPSLTFIVMFGVFLNLCFLSYSIFFKKSIATTYTTSVLHTEASKADSMSYNSQCPDLAFIDIDNNMIDLTSWAGNVIVLKFSRFFKTDLPELIYLDHVARSLKNAAVKVLFINSRGKHERELIDEYAHFSVPIVEDNGHIAVAFNAYQMDLIIVSRDFNIKYKHASFDKPTIYEEILRWTYENKDLNDPVRDEDFRAALSRINFFEIKGNKLRSLNDAIFQHRSIVSVFTSTCLSCEESERLRILKEYATQNPGQAVNVVLFGRGNTIGAIRQYADYNGLLNDNMLIGVIDDQTEPSENNDLGIFDFHVDPRTFILDSQGKLIFIENPRNSARVSMGLLESLR